MTETGNLHLKKPSQEDFYNVDDFNLNSDLLDAKIGDMATQLAHKVDANEVGQPNGIATLNGNGKLAQMPTAADVGAVPASAISSVSTANGYYLRLPGVLIQWASKTATIQANSGVALTWSFPVAYSNYGYKVFATPIYESTSNIKYAQVAKPGSYYSAAVYLYNAQSSSVEISVNLLVIGTV